MKDSYSFDRDEAGLDVSFQAHEEAYERIFERCGVEAFVVEAESGIMGGRESLGLPRAHRLGREQLVRCENGDYYADIEAARGVAACRRTSRLRSMRRRRSRRRA